MNILVELTKLRAVNAELLAACKLVATLCWKNGVGNEIPRGAGGMNQIYKAVSEAITKAERGK